jgi:formyl-CoA transferase
MFAFQGILAALVSRQRSGQGQVVDIALSEACLALLESTIPDYDRAGHVRQASGTRLDRIAPSNLYKSADGRWVIIAANQDTVFARLCQLMKRPELAHDPRFVNHVARGQHQDEIDEIVAAWASGWNADELSKLLTEAGVVSGSISNVADLVQDPQFAAREMLVPHFDKGINANVLGPGVVPKMIGTPGSVRWAGPPAPGYDNASVYGELLGLGPRELGRLAADGVI